MTTQTEPDRNAVSSMQPSYDYKRYAVLYVDDEEIALKYFQRNLGGDFRILTAKNAAEAMKILDKQGDEIGVLLTDQRMPGDTGVKLLEHARKMRPSIIRMLITAYADHEAAVAAVNDGRIFHYISKPIDVEEMTGILRQAMESLLDQLKLNKKLIDNTSALIVVLDREMRITHLNPALERAFGYKLSDVAGRSAWEAGVMDPGEIPQSKERVQKLLEGEPSVRSLVRFRTKDGNWRLVDVVTTAIRDSRGEIEGFVVTGTDVTELNRLQQEVVRISEQEHARIGHDLHDGVGQTLCGITSLMEGLEAELTGPQRQQAERIRSILHKAVQDVRRLSHGLSPSAVKNRGLGGSLRLLAETVRENFRTECACEIDERIKVGSEDMESHLFRIAQEAVSNALRHGKATRIEISLKPESGAQRCELSISDNGRGFGGENVSSADGIGIRVMKYRSALIGAELRIKSNPGGGAKVSCYFACLKHRRTTKS